jgi:hypothetical protein
MEPDGTPAWYFSDGGAPASVMTGLVGIGPLPGTPETSFWKNQSDFFVTSSYSASLWPVQRVDFASGTVIATSVITGAFSIIGGSAHHVYVAEVTAGRIYQLVRTTLVDEQFWTNPLFVGVTLGYVYSDDALYFRSNTLGIGGDNFFLFQPSTNTVTPLGVTPFNSSPGVVASMLVVNPTYMVFAELDANTNSASIGYMFESLGQTDMLLADIVADICARAGMSLAEYDVSSLTDRVKGFAITSHSSTRANLAPLMATYFFDACDIDGQIRFVRRGTNPVGAFAYDDLGASSSIGDQANENPITEVIAQEVDLPRTLSFSYSGLNSDYLVNTQRAFRSNTRSNQDVTMAAPIVLPDDEGLMRAQTMLWSAWVGRKTFQISTRLAYLPYEPGDVMTLYGAAGQAYTVRVVRCAYDGQGALQWSLVLEEPDIYPSPGYNTQGGAPSGFTVQTIDYSGPTALAVLDVPPLRDTDTSQGLYLAACGYASSWPGVMVDISRDGNSYTDLFRILAPSPIGTTSTALPGFGGGNQPDELSTVTVVLYSGTLASVSYADFLAGVNAAYLGGELIYFRNATQTGANTYVLSGLLRGRVGTEGAMTSHVSGEQFVFLDATKIISAAINVSDIGATLYFEPHLLNLFASQAVTPQILVPSVARVKPLSPVLFNAFHGSALSASDITLSWIRRARVNAQWLSGTDVPLDESAEAYTLDVFSGSTLKRTATVTAATAYTYTGANITADGFTTGNAITFTVTQNSDQGVSGYAATATITR